MGMTDPIADLLTRIRNGKMAGKDYVDVPVSKIKTEILRILRAEGYIRDYAKQDERTLRVHLKYSENREPSFEKIERVSRPGLRVYVNKNEIPKVLGGFGTAILSTSKGILTGHEARMAGVGGEVICRIY